MSKVYSGKLRRISLGTSRVFRNSCETEAPVLLSFYFRYSKMQSRTWTWRTCARERRRAVGRPIIGTPQGLKTASEPTCAYLHTATTSLRNLGYIPIKKVVLGTRPSPALRDSVTTVPAPEARQAPQGDALHRAKSAPTVQITSHFSI